MGYITPPTNELNASPAPLVSSFSCRGPSLLAPELLKPDVNVPGMSILAAVSPLAPVLFNLDSGTLLVLSVFSRRYIKSAMIKSAIMTTATMMDNSNQPIKDYTGEPVTDAI